MFGRQTSAKIASALKHPIETTNSRHSKMGQFNEWRQLASLLDPAELKKRCETYWGLVSAISGLTAGFSYLVTTGSDLNFTRPEFIEPISRADFFGFLTVMAFVFSISATLLASTLNGYLNLGGEDNAKDFVKMVWFIVDIPMVFCIMGLLFMFLSGVIYLGGMYSYWVWMAAVAVGGGMVAMMMVVFAVVRQRVHNKIDREYKAVSK